MGGVASIILSVKMANLLLCAVFILLSIQQTVVGFNLETRIPIIKVGNRGSYFGYSVAEHQTVTEDGDQISWLLVGAPLDQNRQPKTNHSGALWKCPLTTRMNDCEQVVTDGKRSRQLHGHYDKSIDSNDLQPPRDDEVKDGQWLGVSVKSQGVGGKAVVCAHRYIRKSGESRFGMGLCYTLDNELNYDMNHEPCHGRPIEREHEDFAYCQVGTSSSFLDDGFIILGAPGPQTWRGTIFAIDTNSDFLDRDKTIYMAPVYNNNSPVKIYSYLGMSVTGGHFFGKYFSYAAGAPRSEGHGQVVLFSRNAYTPWNPMNVTKVINGEQFASNFGYEVASADVNGDGKTDLMVGAPFYFTRNEGGAVYIYLNNNYSFSSEADIKLTGKLESRYGFAIANAGDLNKDGCDDLAIGSPYEGNGVVYIYLGHKSKGLEKEPKQIIIAEMLPRVLKTFGYSLSGGVDLDLNGYPDLLVGAYDQNAIALLRSRPIIDIKTFVKPSSVLKNVDPLKHGCDKDPEANHTCFSFEACCTIESIVKPVTSTSLRLNYVIEAETFHGGRKFSRVFFGGAQRSNVINKTIELSKESSVHCQEHIVYIKENTRDIQSPINFQLNYSLVQPHPQWSPSGPLPSIERLPVLNATATTSFSATFLNDCGIDGICESDISTKAVLELPIGESKDSYILTLGQEDEIRLTVTVDNFGESAYEAQLFVSHHPDVHYIATTVEDKHVTCNLFNKSMVACSLGNPFKKQLPEPKPIILRFDPKSLEDHELSVEFSVWANSTSKEVTAGKPPAHVEALVVKNAELSIKGTARPEQVFYGGEVRGEAAMKYLDDIGSRVQHTYQVYNEGPWRVTSVEIIIDWPHQVANDKLQGKWLLYPDSAPTVEAQGGGECFVNSKHINPLNLSSKPGVVEVPLENLVKPDPLLDGKNRWTKEEPAANNQTASDGISARNSLRHKRDSEMIVKPEAYTDKDGSRRQAVYMNCLEGTAKCIRITCVIYKLARNQAATVSIKARLWNSTLVEDYARMAQVVVSSSATIRLPQHYNIHQNNLEDDFTIVETIAYPDLVSVEPSGVPLWVIILSVVVGLVVLVILIFFLWKFGFFKRRRPDPTLSGNIEKNHEGSPFLGQENRNSLR